MIRIATPSRLLGPLVPGFARARWSGHIDTALSMADSVVEGTDERAQSLRTTLIAFVIRIISAFIAFVSQVLMARWLGGHEYGIFVWVWVAAIICGNLACLGFPSAVVKFIPKYLVEGDEASLRGIIFGSRLFSLVFATLIAVVGIVAAYALDEQLSSIYSVPLIMAAICLPMLSLADAQNGIARAFSWADLAFSPIYLVRPMLILAGMIVALMSGMAATAATALTATIVATWLTSIMQMLIMNRRAKNVIPAGPKRFSLGTWIMVALPIFLIDGFYVLLTSVDIMIVGVYMSPNEVGIYFAAAKTLALVHFVYFAVKAGAAHRYSQYFSSGDTKKFESFVQDTIKWTFWPSLLMAALILLSGKFLLGLFGTEFEAGYPLLFILVIGIIARASVGPAESALTMSGHHNVCVLIYSASLAINVALNLTFIPKFGLAGAAWATTAAMLFEAMTLYFVTLRKLGIQMFIFARPGGLAMPSTKAEF